VMVTTNIETDLDIANGARGEIVDIILHPDEPPLSSCSIQNLVFLPLYILVKLNRTRANGLQDLDDGIIPIECTTQSLQIITSSPDQRTIKKTVKRRQFPITGAYAFTDYRSQGQTLPYVIIDIASPPSGKLSLFNLYVALSRSHGRSNIRLLRDFDENIFKQSHDMALISEDERLQQLNASTKLWWNALSDQI
jgi:ATP-dependent exoDNAse (exonuclease V) alpha subunit